MDVLAVRKMAASSRATVAVRVTVIVPSPSLTVTGSMAYCGSASSFSMTAGLDAAPSITAPDTLLRSRKNLSGNPSWTSSSTIGTETVFDVSPLRKVNVFETAV